MFDIAVMPDGSIYATEHDMSLQMEGLDKPRRKRGRPPKIHAEGDIKDIEDIQDGGSQGEDDKQDEDDEIDGDGRRRRKRKVPKRFSEAVQGKELERIFKEEGVIDDEEDEVDRDYDDTVERMNVPVADANEEIIGHLETEEGKDLGELVIVNRGRGRGRPKLRRKKTRFTCNLCGRGFLQRSRYIMHKTFHKSVRYECLECNKRFTNTDNFMLHQKTTGHKGEQTIKTTPEKNDSALDGLLEIKIENSGASTQNSTKIPDDSNIKTETEWKMGLSSNTKVNEELNELNMFNCNECNEKFETKQDCEIHLKSHLPEKSFACNFCEKTFSYQSNLKGHLLTHEVSKTEKGFACDICGKILNHPSSVVYHKEAEHNNGRRFVCNKCKKSFKHKQLLQRHQLVHSDDRPYVCKSCNSSFKTKANLINHQLTHTGEKKYSCEICGQQFAHKTSLTLHYRWHTGHKPYTCEVCNKSFSQNGNLQEHMRIHTGEKPYSCEHCGRKFTTSSQFKLHVKRHTGERPWKCEFCAKSFLHKDTWKCHVRRHKGERPFQCSQCNRGFTEQWALKKHLRLHTGEKPYSCEICGKAFADCSNLTKHKKVHRENKVLGVNELSKPSADTELWQILPTPSGDDDSLNAHITQVITTEEGSEDGRPQIIYVSYQDPDDPNQSRTLHFGMIEDKDSAAAGQSLPTLDDEENEMISKQETHSIDQSDGHIDMALSDENLHVQITDEDGNPIPLSIAARQFLSHNEFVSQLNDGQTIRVHSEVVSEELAEQLGVHVNQSIGIDSINDMENVVDTSGIAISSSEENTDAIVKVLGNVDNQSATLAVNQITNDDIEELDEGEQTIEFTTQDGQKVRLVTSYHVDPSQLTSEYLTIV